MAGVFFRSLTLTMAVASLTSLILAVTLTPALASIFLKDTGQLEHDRAPENEEGGFIMRPVLWLFDCMLRKGPRDPQDH